MNEVFFTADLHLGHNQPFIYNKRGFGSVEEHDAAIIDNINRNVAATDNLYILGDLMLGDNNKGIQALGQIRCENVFVIPGNHDTRARLRLYEEELGFVILGNAHLMKAAKRSFMLSHYPMATANFDDDKKTWERVYNLCGHTHYPYKIDPATRSIQIGVDAWNNQPVGLEEVKNLIVDYAAVIRLAHHIP